MGVDQRNSYELYWNYTTIEYIALANFKNIMPYNRFVIILRCLHVCGNTKIDGMDKLAQIHSMLNIMVAAWQAAYYPNREICLDDSRAEPVRWFISPKSLINGGCRRGSWPIQELHTAVNKLFNCCQSLNQSNSNKPSLQKRGQHMFQRKLYTNYVFCVMYCLLCYVLFVVYYSTVLCQQSNANFFNKI